MGHGIVIAVAKGLLLVLGILVPAGVGVAVGLLGRALGGAVALPASAMLGAAAASLLLLVEAWVVSEFLGRRFTALDPAAEGILP
jgi:hypothetical protein